MRGCVAASTSVLLVLLDIFGSMLLLGGKRGPALGPLSTYKRPLCGRANIASVKS